MTNTADTWPAGATWVFQGTIAEDGTGGTHVCTLTVIPGIGNEMQVLYGRIVNGNTATAQLMTARIDDGTNILAQWISISDTSANVERSFPVGINPVTNTNLFTIFPNPAGFTVSGTQRLLLAVQTAAISVTQTFAVVCRIKGAKPTATLADTVGTPVLTVNTNAVF